MERENRGGRADDPAQTAADAAAFTLYRRRLERVVAGACDPSQPWAARVAAAIRAALTLATTDPVAARALTVHAAQRRIDGGIAFAAMVDGLAEKLACDAPPTTHADRTARNLVRRIARQTFLHLELRPGDPVTEIAPDLIVFALTPYVGFSESRRWASGPS